MKTGIELIAEERQEQIEKHGWTLEHDKEHELGILVKVAAVLAVSHTDAYVEDEAGECSSYDNIWGLEHKHKNDTIYRLKVAGALIAAEIDRLNALKVNNDENV